MESVARLLVSNGYGIAIAGLGTIKPVSTLSPKRVTVAVRAVLRDRYGPKKLRSHVRLSGLRADGEVDVELLANS